MRYIHLKKWRIVSQSSTIYMKKIIIPALFIALLGVSACKKLKVDDEPYLKYTVNGTEYSYNNDVFSAAVENVNGVQVWSLQKGCIDCANSFTLQTKTDIALNTPHPVIGLISSDKATLYVGNIYYKLYNGVVNVKHLSTSVEINSYMEGSFNLTLINNANNSDTVRVTNGTFFHNNYSISG